MTCYRMPLFASLALATFMMTSPRPRSFAAEESTALPAVRNLDWSGVAGNGHDLALTREGETLSIVTQGGDPYFFFNVPVLGRNPSDWMLEIEYFCPRGIEGMEWRSGSKLHSPEPSVMPAMAPAEGWTTYVANLTQLAGESYDPQKPLRIRIDLGRRPETRLQIRRVVVRSMTARETERKTHAAEQIRSKEDLASQIRRYRSRSWPMELVSASIRGNLIVVRGRVKNDESRMVGSVVVRHLNSVSASEPTADEVARRWPIKMDPNQNTFHAEIPMDSNSLTGLIGTRVQVMGPATSEMGESQPLSAVRYVAPPASATLPAPPTLTAAKGLTCITRRFSTSQLSELGIRHASVNLIVRDLVSDVPRGQWKKTTLLGRTWWVNEPRLQAYDRDVRTSTDGGIVVAGILLIPTSRSGPSLMEHPESTSAGTYAMPNLTRQKAATHYAAALELLAARYDGRTEQHGRIDHWIIHNEIDYGWQWTNMGEQPMEIFLDHYVRSMRMADFAMRRHNPHAKVFVSLTHRWNSQDNRHWKTYPPRRILQWLNRDRVLEGDFAWGVAYHPYPQSLWKAETWADTKVSDDFDTPLITVKNLQVLDRFMHLPESRRDDGTLRPVLCSEQGFHAEQDSPEQLRVQAAALLYTFQKLRQCPSILAFDYHRPSDHPAEGGLRLGLRGLPDSDHPLGPPKPAWAVYAAIGTDREADLIKTYQSMWQHDVGSEPPPVNDAQ